MAAAREDWVRNRPGLVAAHDRAGWQRIVANGAPPYLVFGFGDRQARKSGACMFGAHFQLPGDVRLGDVARALNDTAELLTAMARHQR